MNVVSNTSGQEIKSGEATETLPAGCCLYTTTIAVPQGTNVWIAVTVSDRPGGLGEASAEKTL